ncbi:MAG TPA: Ig-like domain-containing protein, partial [Longimicrobiales bacterium]|nr:Ig-like domain-containing protein [Longimicrobiales bacterium]
MSGARGFRGAARRGLLTAAAACGVAWAAACANQGAPPGGPPDQRPPVVVRTEPEPFAVLSDLRRPVRFLFDERISEQMGVPIDEAVTVSPRTGEVEVEKGSRSIDVRLEGGFQPGLVYRVTLRPVVRDLFGNALQDPFELVFSTGGEPAPTVVAGQVWDRVSGRGVRDAVVQAVGADSLVHVGRSDQEGIFALRYLPPGAFVVTAYDDLDRDATLDERETQGSVRVDLGAADTVLVDIPVLAPDSTPALLVRARALDSLTIVAETDDFLDPSRSGEELDVSLTREEGAA